MAWALLFLTYAYAALHGLSNAVLYGRLGADTFNGQAPRPWRWLANEHRVLVAERVTVWLAVGLAAYLGFAGTLPVLLAGALGFSAWHEEAYNWGRAAISRTPYRFGYHSPTDTAACQLTGLIRLLMATLGLLLYGLFLTF